jgi:hypothetical protein
MGMMNLLAPRYLLKEAEAQISSGDIIAKDTFSIGSRAIDKV